MIAEQTEEEIRPIPPPDDWPQTSDGTTDWEALFEMPGTGLISFADSSTAPDQLKKQTQAIIRSVFIRKRDQKLTKKVMTYLDKLIRDGHDYDAGQFETLRAHVKQMMRKVKKDRIKRSAAFVANKNKKTKQKKSKIRSVNRRANPIVGFFSKSRSATAILMLTVGILSLVGIISFSPDRNVPKGDVKEHIEWLSRHLINQLPHQTWKLKSVKQSKESEIAIEIQISDSQHINLIKSMKRIARVAVLNQVCPKIGSGVETILDQGWHLWVTLKTENETLTGGTCHYQTIETKS